MFSIIIPYYKKRQFIERCLDSVLAQTFTDYEIILVDDGSEDDIGKLINDKYKDKIKFIKQQNQGVSVARNTGIAAATKPYIAFLDADDFWSPYYLEKCSQILSLHTNIKILGTHYCKNKNFIEDSNNDLKYHKIENYFKSAIVNTIFFTSATVVNKVFFVSNLGFNPNLKSGEDLDVWFRVILSEGDAYYIQNTLVYYSDEDENQATKKAPPFQNRFVSNIKSMYYDHDRQKYSPEFYEFLSKFAYSGLFRFYNSGNKKEAVEIYKNLSPRFFLADLYYSLPFFKSNHKWSRKYFKFLFKYIYK